MTAGEKRKTFLQESYLIQAWLVLLLASTFGGTLAAVQLKLGPLVAENKTRETVAQIPELIWGATSPDKPAAQKGEISIQNRLIKAGQGFYLVYEALENGKCAGWVVKSTGQGYADRIELLIGLDGKCEKITGLFILDQKETPGLGNKIIGAPWRSQFIGKDTRIPLTAVRKGTMAPDQIDAITGATISSGSVCRIINRTLQDLQKTLSETANAEEQKK